MITSLAGTVNREVNKKSFGQKICEKIRYCCCCCCFGKDDKQKAEDYQNIEDKESFISQSRPIPIRDSLPKIDDKKLIEICYKLNSSQKEQAINVCTKFFKNYESLREIIDESAREQEISYFQKMNKISHYSSLISAIKSLIELKLLEKEEENKDIQFLSIKFKIILDTLDLPRSNSFSFSGRRQARSFDSSKSDSPFMFGESIHEEKDGFSPRPSLPLPSLNFNSKQSVSRPISPSRSLLTQALTSASPRVSRSDK